jgi:hypothetical protein
MINPLLSVDDLRKCDLHIRTQATLYYFFTSCLVVIATAKVVVIG